MLGMTLAELDERMSSKELAIWETWLVRRARQASGKGGRGKVRLAGRSPAEQFEAIRAALGR